MDHLGRASGERSGRGKLAFWRGHIGAWREGGLSQAAYCRKQDLKVCQFTYWKKQIAGHGEATGASVTLVQLPLKTQVMNQGEKSMSSKSAPVELRVAGRYPVTIPEGFDQASLKRLIQLLESL